MYRDELGAVPPEVVIALRDALSWSSVDDFWSIWSKNAEVFSGHIVGPVVPLQLAALPFKEEACYVFVAGVWEVELLAAGDLPGSARLYRTSHGDEVDVHCAQYFVNSSLAPVVFFRIRLKSVADVLKGIRSEGFTYSV